MIELDVEGPAPLSGIRFADLFAGIGGFRLAMESLGARCVFSSEWDKEAARVYRLNHGDAPLGDITQIPESEIPKFDALCAGFPCQAFSVSGKQRGFADSRGTLFFDVARIAKSARPQFVFMENVKNFARHDGGKTLEVVEGTMREIGYDFHAKVLNAADYGVPQRRERIYMVCFRQDLKRAPFRFPQPRPLTTSLNDLLLPKRKVSRECFIRRDDYRPTASAPGVASAQPLPPRARKVGIVGKGGQGERIYDPSGVAVTLSAYGGGAFAKTGGYMIDGKLRKLDTRECARLMGFPDSFKLSPSRHQAYKQFGNSVVVDVLQQILVNIACSLNREPPKL